MSRHSQSEKLTRIPLDEARTLRRGLRLVIRFVGLNHVQTIQIMTVEDASILYGLRQPSGYWAVRKALRTEWDEVLASGEIVAAFQCCEVRETEPRTRRSRASTHRHQGGFS